MSVFVHAYGHHHPPNEITNRFLEELDIGTNDEWILERVGIRSRRTLLSLDYIRTTRNRDIRGAREASVYSNAEMGAGAARMALARAGLDASALGMVLCGSSAPDYLSPADACTVAAQLGIDVPCFDINSACTSFLAQMRVLWLMDPAKLPDYVLLLSPDSLTKTVDYSDRSASVLWGDAAAAAIVSTRVPGPARLVATSLDSRPTAFAKVVVPRLGYFHQEGRTVQAFAIRETAKAFDEIRAQHAADANRLHFIGHQANLRMLEAVCERCAIPAERHHSNAEHYGNTGAASSASVISMNWEKWRAGDEIAVVGVGAGLTWASYLLRFGEDR